MSTTSTKGGVNVKLLRKYVRWVQSQSKLADSRRVWNQSVWLARRNRSAPACQTAMCLAGKVVTDHGWKPAWVSESGWWHGGSTTGVSFTQVTKGGRTRSVEEVALEILGLEDWQSDIFNAANSAEAIKAYAEEYIEKSR